jgi:hypothetical protein
VLKLFKDINLVILLIKSFYYYLFVRLLGFKVDSFKLFIIINCIKVVRKLKQLNNLNDLERYIKIASFLRRFVP